MIFCLFDINEETIKLVFLRAGVVFRECTEFMLCIIFTLVRVVHISRGFISGSYCRFYDISTKRKINTRTFLSLKLLDILTYSLQAIQESNKTANMYKTRNFDVLLKLLLG